MNTTHAPTVNHEKKTRINGATFLPPLVERSNYRTFDKRWEALSYTILKRMETIKVARTITKVETIYTMGELSGVNYRNAIDSVSRLRMEFWSEFSSSEVVETMEKAAETFGMRLSDCSIGLFNRSRVEVDTEGFDDEQAPYAVEWLEHKLPAGLDGAYPFTGVVYDYLFFEYFQTNGIPTAKTVKSEIVKAIMYVLHKSIDSEERSILSDDDALEYIEANEVEFYGDGTVFHG